MGTGEMDQTKACGRASLQIEMLMGKFKAETHLHLSPLPLNLKLGQMRVEGQATPEQVKSTV